MDYISTDKNNVCPFCNDERKSLTSLHQHSIRCKENPNRIKTDKNKVAAGAKKAGEIFRNRAIEKYKKNPKHCPQCEACILYNYRNNQFCCASCAATYGNIHSSPDRKRGPAPSKHKKIKQQTVEGPYSKICLCTCNHCNTRFCKRKQTKYCDNCVDKYSHNQRARFWFTFAFEPYSDLFDIEKIRSLGMWHPTKNPNGLCRDHRVSVNESIRNGYDPYYITHPINCEFITHAENSKKYTKSSITYEVLIIAVNEYDLRRNK